MSIPYIPFHLPSIGREEIAAVEKVLRSGWLTTGPVAQEFEKEFASYVGCKHALAVNSGTSALQLALEAIGLKQGDEVLVPTNTFTATGEVATYFGATPVLCDSRRRRIQHRSCRCGKENHLEDQSHHSGTHRRRTMRHGGDRRPRCATSSACD